MGIVQADRMWQANGRHSLLVGDQKGASSPLEEVFGRWQDELLGTLYILLGSLHEAKKAFKETFLYCWQRREQLSHLTDRKLWIFQAALETARQRRATAWRRRWRLWNLDNPEHELPPARESMELEETANPELAFWRRVLMELPPEEQEVFLLRQNGQMTYEQIADMLHSPLGVVKAQMHRALIKLQEAARARATSMPGPFCSSSGGIATESPTASETVEVSIGIASTLPSALEHPQKEDTSASIPFLPMK
ncbi:MAG: RNA polymerase sigma factor [Thermoguttaceae bacterium]|nr:RNA polymerase sigma factor [Thermoguttaceae bacterium]MDW8039240.1 RNA polymerase sigma factor [Thermoguttaceae bacterium]